MSSDRRVPDSADLEHPLSARARLVCRAVFVALGLAAAGAFAQDDDPGHFEVRSGSVELAANVYFLSARLEYRLSTDARGALESGLPLTIRLEIELLNRRPMWMDTEVASLTQLYQLEYHALTERYIVRNVNSGDQDSFATLFAALNFLGRVDRLPIIDAALLDPERTYDIRIRALLDTEQLPGPLRLLAFWRRDWSLGSEWYRWRLADD
ncbi:MAG TPA: DUF4390 domain-containing protein [Gammaproteobacteria bacterium]